MTPEERDRLTKLEAWYEMLTKQVKDMRDDFALQIVSIRNHHTTEFASINKKLDDIVARLEQGKGAWYAEDMTPETCFGCLTSSPPMRVEDDHA